MNITSLLANTQHGIQGILVSFGPFILIIIVMYFLLFRSQQKKVKERQKMLNSVEVGDKLITTGGIIGIVSLIKENSIFLKVSDNVKLEVIQSAISSITKKHAN